MKSRLIHLSFLSTGILFCLLVIQNLPAYGEGSIVLYLGYSSTFEKYPYKYIYELSGVFETEHLRRVLGYQVQYFLPNKKSGVSLEIFHQKSENVSHYLIEGIQTSGDIRNAYFLSLNYDFRFFPDKNKKINPYLSLGAYIATHLFDDEPGYMRNKANIGIKIGSGLRLKLAKKFLMNTAVYYFPVYGFISGKIGLEYVF